MLLEPWTELIVLAQHVLRWRWAHIGALVTRIWLTTPNATLIEQMRSCHALLPRVSAALVAVGERKTLGVVLPSGLRCQHSLAGRLGDLAGHDGVDDGVVDVRQALN